MLEAAIDPYRTTDWSGAIRSFTVKKLSPHIGAEIGNIDLTKPLSDEQVEDLHRAFAQNCVLFFRDQKISFEDQKRLGLYFGEMHVHVGPSTESKALDGDPVVRRQHFDDKSKKVSGEVWHTDQSCAEPPPLGSILYNHTIPPDGGGDTLFANMYKAYDELPPRMKTYLEGLTATHDGTFAFGKNAPVAVHPVVPRHPVTGKQLLYVNIGFTTKINELKHDESATLLQYLFNHATDARWSMRFRWEPHSIAFWDNRCTQHQAIWDYFPHTRSGYRVQIKGWENPKP
jgi:taurine dioxygenase